MTEPDGKINTCDVVQSSTSPEDYLTVLIVRSNALMTKRLYLKDDGSVGKTGYGKGFLFDAQKIAVNDFADLAEALIHLNFATNKFIIRAMPLQHHNVRRKMHGEGAAFAPDPAGHHWMFLDFDDVPLPAHINFNDTEACLAYLISLLPDSFRNVSFYWQWSCGHGLKRTSLRCHLFFWCATKHTDKDFENWAKWHNGLDANAKLLDPSVFRTVQPNFTAAPVIDDAIADPVEERYGVHLADVNEVVIHVPEQKWEDHVIEQERAEYKARVKQGLRPEASYANGAAWVPPGAVDERFLYYMTRIGDGAACDGFHDPLTKAIWFWALSHPPREDAAFKDALRVMITEAVCTKQRDLDHYRSDYYLDSSLRGAREKAPKEPADRIQNRLDWQKKRNQKPITEEEHLNKLAALDLLLAAAAG